MAIIIISMVLLDMCFQYSLASDIYVKSPKDEIADIRKLLQDQNERILKLESENLALKSRLSHVEEDNADLREQVVGVTKKHELLKDEVVNLRSQLSEMEDLPEQNNPQTSGVLLKDNASPSNTKIRKDSVHVSSISTWKGLSPITTNMNSMQAYLCVILTYFWTNQVR